MSKNDNITFAPLPNTAEFVQNYMDNGGTKDQALSVLSHLLELAVSMYQKGDIKTIKQPNKMELVCQLKKGSRRLMLTE